MSVNVQITIISRTKALQKKKNMHKSKKWNIDKGLMVKKKKRLFYH